MKQHKEGGDVSMKDLEILYKLANKELCDGSCALKLPEEKCPECKARKVLNEFDEMVDQVMQEIRHECWIQKGIGAYYDDIYLGSIGKYSQ